MIDLDHELFDNLWELNPYGSKEACYYVTRNFLNEQPLDEQNRVITFEVLFDKYKEYVNYLEPFNKNPQYAKKGMELLPIDEYIGQSLYLRSYKAPKKARDGYLFGDFPIDYLRVRIREFKKKFRHEETVE